MSDIERLRKLIDRLPAEALADAGVFPFAGADCSDDELRQYIDEAGPVTVQPAIDYVMKDLRPVQVMQLIERARERGSSQLGVAGSFGSARLGKQISSAQNDMLAVLMIVGEGIAFADPEAHNGVDGYKGLAVAFQSAADFYRHMASMHRMEEPAPLDRPEDILPRHLGRVGSKNGTRAQRLSELASPVALTLGQTLNLYHRVRKLEKSDE